MSDPAAEQSTEVRCPGGALHFKVIDGGRIEVKCSRPQCTEGKFVVLHRYSIPDDDSDCVLLETLKLKDPIVRGRGARTFRKDQ